MSGFTEWTALRQLRDGCGYTVMRDGLSIWAPLSPLTYHVGAEGSAQIITVPAMADVAALSDAQLLVRYKTGQGFFTDLGSIPGVFRNIENPAGAGVPAFLVHDYLYANKGKDCGHYVDPVGATGPSFPYTRAEADAILREALKACGVNMLNRNIIYAGVRAGGAGGWGH